MTAESYDIAHCTALLPACTISRRFAALRTGMALCMAFCFFSFFAAAQKGNWTIKHYTTEDGLPQNSVRFAAVDEKGFIWLGSENGITRFDGQYFRVFNLANTAKVFTNTDRIRGIFADKKHHVFFNDAGFRAFEVKDYNTIAGVGGRVESEYAISTNNGLIRRSSLDETFAITSPDKRKDLVQNERLRYKIYKISEDEEYIGLDSFCYMKHHKIFKMLVPGQDAFILNDTAYHINRDRTVSVFYRESTLDRADLLTGDIRSDPQFGTAEIRVIPAGSTCLAAIGNNYYRISRAGRLLQAKLLFKNLAMPAYENVVYDDVHDRFIICTVADGFYILKAVPFQMVYEQLPPFTNYMNAFSTQVLLPGDSIVISRNVLFDKEGRQMKTVKDLATIGAADKDGNYWWDFTTLQKRNAKLQTVLEMPNTSSRFGFDIFVNDTLNGLLWTFSEHALNIISEADKEIKTLPVKGFDDQKLNFISAKGRGDFWLGADSGLYILRLSDLSVKKIANTAGKIMRMITPDPANDIYWVGTYGSGPCYIEHDTLKQLPLDRNANLAYAHYFFEDKKGFMWIATNNGLYMASKKDLLGFIHNKSYPLYYQYFDKEDGFSTNEFNGGYSNPYVRKRDGTLSLSSMKGLVWFVPEEISPALPDKPIYIDRITVNNTDTIVAGLLKLPNDYARLTIGITTPFLGNKKNLFLEYKLNIDTRWLPVGDDKIELNRLPAGEYELTVRKKGSFGSMYEYASFKFEVLPAWYQTLWFKILAVLLSIGLIMLGLRLRLRALLKRKKELERQVEDRTAQLTYTVQELSTSQQALMESNKIKDTLVGLVLHDLRSPIRFMNTVITHIAQSRNKLPQYDFREEIEELKKSSGALNDFTDQFFTWISSQHERFRVNESAFHVENVLQDICGLYSQLFAKHRNECIIVPTMIICKTDKNILFTILRNIADNANKNTLDGTITFRAGVQKNVVSISIADTGKGMSRARMEEIQRDDFALNNSQFGFKMIIDMAEKINATIKVESVLGEGTVVTLFIVQA